MTKQEILLKMLREAGLTLPEGSALMSTRASRASRNNGAWSWFALGPRGEELRIGSRETMTELIRAERLYVLKSAYSLPYQVADIEVSAHPGGS